MSTDFSATRNKKVRKNTVLVDSTMSSEKKRNLSIKNDKKVRKSTLLIDSTMSSEKKRNLSIKNEAHNKKVRKNTLLVDSTMSSKKKRNSSMENEAHNKKVRKNTRLDDAIQKEIENIEDMLNHPLSYRARDLRSLEVFLVCLKNNLLRGHEGRFVVINDGELWPRTFASAHDIFGEEGLKGNVENTVYMVPTDINVGRTTMMASNTQLFPTQNEPTMDVKLIATLSDNSTKEHSGTFLVDTGASETSCIVHSWHDNGQKFDDSSKGDQYSCVTQTWLPLPFWGKGNAPFHTRESNIHVDTANGEQRATRLRFEEGILQAQVGDMAPVTVKTLLLPPSKAKTLHLPKTTGTHVSFREPVSPPNLLLGRDILFKHFNLEISKEPSCDVLLTLTERDPKTPPPKSLRGRALSTFAAIGKVIGETLGRMSKSREGHPDLSSEHDDDL
jgi:hypothetical protein